MKTKKALYASTWGNLKKLVKSGNNDFLREMKKQASEFGWLPGDSEEESWGKNIEALKVLFNKAMLPEDVIVCFEYRAPIAGRVDCMLFGKGVDGINNVVLFELKGWKKAELSYNNTLLETWTGNAMRDVEHPSVQAGGYAIHFKNFIELLNTKEYHLTSLAYCYNYKKQDGADALYHPNFSKAMESNPLFIKGDEQRLIEILSTLLSKGQGEVVFNAISQAKLEPTKEFISSAANIVIDPNNDGFYMLGDQNVAYTKFEAILKETLEKNRKSVIVIKGGPGTGKSVIALKMLSEVARMGKVPYYTTRSTALRDQLRDALKDTRAKDMIRTIFDFREVY